MKVLVACEFSGIVRDAFIAKGHDAVSCDLIETESPGPHIIGNVLAVLDQGWDLMIAHPPCTYLTNAGVRHLYSIPSSRGILPKVHGEARWEAMRNDAAFFNALYNAPIPHIAIENPIMHKYALEAIGGMNYTQIVQPWQFGHGETKKTCLWLKNLPPLQPTNIVDGRYGRVHRASPGPTRWKERSRTYTGIAEAMAEQWGISIVVDLLEATIESSTV